GRAALRDRAVARRRLVRCRGAAVDRYPEGWFEFGVNSVDKCSSFVGQAEDLTGGTHSVDESAECALELEVLECGFGGGLFSLDCRSRVITFRAGKKVLEISNY